MTNPDRLAPNGGSADRTLPTYREELAGVPVILKNSVKEVVVDGEKGTIVPDLDGLQFAIAMARVSINLKISGPEIRMLRKTIGLQAKSLADWLDVTPETFSRWENGRDPIQTNPERLLRLKVYQALRSKVFGVSVTAEDIVNMKTLPMRLVGSPLTLIFERMPVAVEGKVECSWFYRGLDEDGEIPEKIRA